MKKILSLICALVLLCLPLAASAAQGDRLLARRDDGFEDYINGCCAIGNTLYLQGENSIYSWQVGDEDFKAYPIEMNIADFLGEETVNSYLTPYLLAGESDPMMLVVATVYGDTMTETAALCKLTLDESGAHYEKLIDIQWSDLSDDGSGYHYVNSASFVGGYLLVSCDNSSGGSSLFRIDPADGSVTDSELVNINGIVPYVDNCALAIQNEYGNGLTTRFIRYDPAAETSEVLGERFSEDYTSVDGVACDLSTGTVYCVRAGEICTMDLTSGECGEALADMPLQSYNNRANLVLEGGYFVTACYEGVVVRNINPGREVTGRLKVYDGSYSGALTAATLDFGETHGDISVALSHDYADAGIGNLIDSMLAHDAGVDVFVISSDNADFEALFNRGYLAALDSDYFSQAMQRLNPALLKQLARDGELVAYPVSGYFMIPYLNTRTLEKLDIDIEDVPANWSDFLDWLPQLAEAIDGREDFSLLDSYSSATDARNTIFYGLFSEYQRSLGLNGGENAYDSARFTELLAKLEAVDFTELGQPEEVDYDEMMSGEMNYLLTLNMGTQLQGITEDTQNKPFVMSLDADTQAMLLLTADVIFVNPFSENHDLAVEFAQAVAERLDDSVSYCIYPDLTTPTPNPTYERSLAEAQKYYDETKAALDKADPVDVPPLEEQLKGAQEWLERAEADKWMIGESDITWIRSHDEQLVLQPANWLWRSDNGDANELIDQYLSGQMNTQQFMSAIDQKIRMMMMEGY